MTIKAVLASPGHFCLVLGNVWKVDLIIIIITNFHWLSSSSLSHSHVWKVDLMIIIVTTNFHQVSSSSSLQTSIIRSHHHRHYKLPSSDLIIIVITNLPQNNQMLLQFPECIAPRGSACGSKWLPKAFPFPFFVEQRQNYGRRADAPPQRRKKRHLAVFCSFFSNAAYPPSRWKWRRQLKAKRQDDSPLTLPHRPKAVAALQCSAVCCRQAATRHCEAALELG